jgi:hypothetical protein
MVENHDFIKENARESQRLRDFALRITDTQLALILPNGWTVSAAFGHLAFWDLRQLAVLKKWLKEGVKAVPIDADTTNEAVNGLANAIPPQATVALAVYAASLIDRELEKIPASLAGEMLNGGHERMLRRSLHRKEHLDKIEKVLHSQQ